MELFLTYDEFDRFDKRCGCKKLLTRDYSDSPPVATFYGQDFTRRSTESRQNQNIDHWEKRMGERYPGNPNQHVQDRDAM